MGQTCIFFGHKDCYGLNAELLKQAMECLIQKDVTEFLVGNQGQFDSMVQSCLKSLQPQYPNIRYYVVLAYMPEENQNDIESFNTIFPEGMESVHPRFAIDRRNTWMLRQGDVCLCYINHTWGGAYKFAHMAKRRGLKIINLGTAEF